MNTRKNNNKSDVDDEVEELLRAAEDAALLKFTLNSHAIHASSSNLHPDLDQRFRNLKTTGSKLKEVSNKNTVPQEPKNVKKEVDDDDLLARFAALKASIPKPPPSTSSSLVGLYTSDTCVDNTGEDDEVDKVIRWAMDAARLDPSPASDDEDNNSDDIDDTDKSDDDTDKSDEDADSPSGNHKNQRK